jgi:dipeptidyl aminopeptidase/acylaminoacyl peptidase
MRVSQVLVLPLLISTLLPAQTPVAVKHPFRIADWTGLRSAGALAVSPDGGTVLYRVRYGATSGPDSSEFWTVHPDGTGAVKLEVPTGFLPQGFVPGGGSLYGTYKVNGESQLAVFGLDGNKVAAAPSVLVALARGVDAIAPSPDGRRFALIADPRMPDKLAAVRTVVEPEQASLYVVKMDGTDGHWACAELRQIGGGEGSSAAPLAWSGDSTQIAVLSSSPKIGHHEVRSQLDVCPVEEGASHARRVTEVLNAVSALAFSGASEIAFVSTPSPTLTPDHIYTVATAGGAAVDRTAELPMTVGSLVSDGHGNVFVEVQHGVHDEVGVWRDGKLTPTYAWTDGAVGPPVFSPYAGSSSQLAFTVGDPTHARNVATLDQGKLRRITSESDAQLAGVELGPVRVVKWTSKEGVALEGIATFPAGYEAGKKYPFLVLPHGGPESNDVLGLDPFSRGIAGMGYVVLQPEYRGSTGYGDAHMVAIYQHFGDRAYRDVDSATDYAIAEGWADPDRLAIFGWSAGGFMTSWTVTQTGRYKAAIEGAGITDWGSFMFTSDVAQTDYDARWPEEDPKAFTQFSAVNFAKNVTTPLLILHGEADVRVPTYQGREFYEVLAARGKTVRMVTYPGSPHFPSLWQQRINVFEEIEAWLTKYNPPSR